MPKPSQPSPSPSKGDEDPVWGDLFGLVGRPPPNPAPRADRPKSAPPSQRQQPKAARKPSNKCVPPDGAGSP